MDFFPVFLSVVYVVRNQNHNLESIIRSASDKLAPLVTDYELIVVDNASIDESIISFKKLTGQSGYPNFQVYMLSKEVDADTASWVGVENALGDFIAVIDPFLDDVDFLPEMLNQAVKGVDVVFANNLQQPYESYSYRAARAVFNFIYNLLNGVDLAREAPKFRLVSKRVVNFILQHRQPALTYRHLPATGGFLRVNMRYSAKPLAKSTKKLSDSIDRGVRLLVSTTYAPMRLVTFLSLFGAIANLFYSFYVLGVGVFKTNIAPGWVSLSLQQSGMFFVISLVLLVLGEYILNMATLSNEGPLYHVGQEFTSSRMLRMERLNVEESSSSSGGLSPHVPKKGR